MTCHQDCSYFRQQEHGHCHQAFALTGVTVQNTSRVSWVGQIAREGGSSTLPVLKTGERLRQEHLARTPATAAALASKPLPGHSPWPDKRAIRCWPVGVPLRGRQCLWSVFHGKNGEGAEVGHTLTIKRVPR